MLAVVATATPASAATTGNTTVTFAVDAGALNITVPATANLGSGAPATAITGSPWPCRCSPSPCAPAAAPPRPDQALSGRAGKSCNGRVKTLPTAVLHVP